MAADPTFASCWNQAGLALKLPNAVNLLGYSNTPNIAAIQDALTQAIDGNYTPAALGAIANMRRSIAATIAPDALRALWRPFLQDMVIAAGQKSLAGASDAAMLDAIRQYMVDNDLLRCRWARRLSGGLGPMVLVLLRAQRGWFWFRTCRGPPDPEVAAARVRT